MVSFSYAENGEQSKVLRSSEIRRDGARDPFPFDKSLAFNIRVHENYLLRINKRERVKLIKTKLRICCMNIHL